MKSCMHSAYLSSVKTDKNKDRFLVFTVYMCYLFIYTNFIHSFIHAEPWSFKILCGKTNALEHPRSMCANILKYVLK